MIFDNERTCLSIQGKRKSHGHELADMKLRSALPHLQTQKISLKTTRFITKKNFLEQFPYYACQKGENVKKKKHTSRRKSMFAITEPKDPE